MSRQRRFIPEHIRPDGRAKRKFKDTDAANRWLSRHHLFAKLYQCGHCGSTHMADVRKANDTDRRALTEKIQKPAAKARVRQTMDALEARRQRERRAIGNAREAFMWQNFRT